MICYFKNLSILALTLVSLNGYAQFKCGNYFHSNFPSDAIWDYQSDPRYISYLSQFKEDQKPISAAPQSIFNSFLENQVSLLERIELSEEFIEENRVRFLGLKQAHKKYREYLKKHPFGTSKFISEKEFKAIYLYSHGTYHPINTLLRNYDLKNLPYNVIEFIENLNSGLEKLPALKKSIILKRGLRTNEKDVLLGFQSVRAFDFQQFLSLHFVEIHGGPTYISI